jgi:hypothetical protein
MCFHFRITSALLSLDWSLDVDIPSMNALIYCCYGRERYSLISGKCLNPGSCSCLVRVRGHIPRANNLNLFRLFARASVQHTHSTVAGHCVCNSAAEVVKSSRTMVWTCRSKRTNAWMEVGRKRPSFRRLRSRRIKTKWTSRKLGGGWLRIVYSGRISYSGLEPSGSASRALVN